MSSLHMDSFEGWEDRVVFETALQPSRSSCAGGGLCGLSEMSPKSQRETMGRLKKRLPAKTYNKIESTAKKSPKPNVVNTPNLGISDPVAKMRAAALAPKPSAAQEAARSAALVAGMNTIKKRQTLALAEQEYRANPSRTTQTKVRDARRDFENAYESWKTNHWAKSIAKCPTCVQSISWADPDLNFAVNKAVGVAVSKLPGPPAAKALTGPLLDIVVPAVSGENITAPEIGNSFSRHITGVDTNKFNGDPLHDIIEGAKGVVGKVYGLGVTGPDTPSIGGGEITSDIPGPGYTPQYTVNFAGMRP